MKYIKIFETFSSDYRKEIDKLNKEKEMIDSKYEDQINKSLNILLERLYKIFKSQNDGWLIGIGDDYYLTNIRGNLNTPGSEFGVLCNNFNIEKNPHYNNGEELDDTWILYTGDTSSDLFDIPLEDVDLYTKSEYLDDIIHGFSNLLNIDIMKKINR